MRPIFTIHAGEYLVATEIEKKFRDLRVWIPSKDIGIDLLVTDESQNKVASLQVKFSKTTSQRWGKPQDHLGLSRADGGHSGAISWRRHPLTIGY
jgi:hypothetical protein